MKVKNLLPIVPYFYIASLVVSVGVILSVLIPFIQRYGLTLQSVYFVVIMSVLTVGMLRNILVFVRDENLVFPKEFLESGEVLLMTINNVWVMTASVPFSFSLDKTHFAITNRRVSMAANIFGFRKFVKRIGMWRDKKYDQTLFGLGTIQDVKLAGDKNEVIIKTDRFSSVFHLYTSQAPRIYELLTSK